MSIKNNITSLQNLLEQVNALPDVGGVKLPGLSNPAIASELFVNKELIDSNGNVITGTFSIDNELSAQDDLIAQIQAAVDSLPEASGDNLDFPYNITVDSNYEVDWYYAWNDEHKALSIFIPTYEGYSANIQSLTINGKTTDFANGNIIGAMRVISIIIPNGGDVILTIEYDLSAPPDFG